MQPFLRSSLRLRVHLYTRSVFEDARDERLRSLLIRVWEKRRGTEKFTRADSTKLDERDWRLEYTIVNHLELAFHSRDATPQCAQGFNSIFRGFAAATELSEASLAFHIRAAERVTTRGGV